MLELAEWAKAPSLNEIAAERLREAAALLARQDDNPYRVAAYRRVAEAIAGLDVDLRDVFEKGGFEALKDIPGVGERIASALAQLVRTGKWIYLERLRGSAEPQDVFCAIPGVGPVLARRLHETLHVETLEQLEAPLHEHSAATILGISAGRLAALRAVLGQMLARLRPLRISRSDEPPIEMLLDIDREYRAKVQADAKDRAQAFQPPRARLGFQFSTLSAGNGISRRSSPIPPERTIWAR